MRAAVLHGQRDLRIEEVPIPTCAPDELLLEVCTVGICGTDAHEYADGPHMFPITDPNPVTGHVGPMVPGHEFSGTVVETGPDVRGFAVGDLVAAGAGYSCGECAQCRRGRTNLCRVYATVGLNRNGALAEYVAVPASACVRADEFGLTPDAAALGQPMSIAVHAMRRGRLTSDDRALIVGAGGIGAFLTFAAAHVSNQITVADINAERLAQADRLGATTVADVTDGSQRLADDGEFTVVYEVTGTPAGLATAKACLSPGTRLVLVGLQAGEGTWDLRQLSLIEHEVIGTNAHVCGQDLPAALGLLSARSGSWSDVAPDVLSLDDLVADGLAALAEGRSGRIKTLIDPRASTTRPSEMGGAS